ncbi:hypothetical protein ElyMa_001318200 [Elysia marginata]|uniref:Uncharacterized protein n=1 Tax=Elysia marginata TaxID=1093978 RepID=A0AAV4IEI1_9GAST|nr:hypothetical protein ElyMa_001318200 [Elysia marginata]
MDQEIQGLNPVLLGRSMFSFRRFAVHAAQPFRHNSGIIALNRGRFCQCDGWSDVLCSYSMALHLDHHPVRWCSPTLIEQSRSHLIIPTNLQHLSSV